MRLLGLLALVGTLAVTAAPAQAAPARQGLFVKKLSITSVPDGPFTTTSRDLCPSGQAETPVAAVIGDYPDGGVDLLVTKRFTCDDGSGTFDMVLFVQLRFAGGFTDNFRWLITTGTGRYRDVQGFGTGVGTTTNGVFLDHYTGYAGTED